MKASQRYHIGILVWRSLHYPGIEHTVDSLAVGVVVPVTIPVLLPFARGVEKQRFAM